MTITTDIRRMSEAEAAWVGAFIEGEGSVSPVYIEVINSDVEIISALIRATRVGRVFLHNYPNPFGKRSEKYFLPYGIIVLNGSSACQEEFKES
ncbi:MAG: hypothetical protein IIC00_11665 [Planctomycetes bacterium]|nr:hypothetical protein [Planctomycetota bacterium]